MPIRPPPLCYENSNECPVGITFVILSREYIWSRDKPRRGAASSACHAELRHRQEFFHFLRDAARSIHTAHREGNSSNLPHFDLPDIWWLGSWQPLRHVARFGAPSTLAEERLPHHTSACLCLKCIPGFI